MCDQSETKTQQITVIQNRHYLILNKNRNKENYKMGGLISVTKKLKE